MSDSQTKHLLYRGRLQRLLDLIGGWEAGSDRRKRSVIHTVAAKTKGALSEVLEQANQGSVPGCEYPGNEFLLLEAESQKIDGDLPLNGTDFDRRRQFVNIGSLGFGNCRHRRW
jgi:hypothetical protein